MVNFFKKYKKEKMITTTKGQGSVPTLASFYFY